MREDEFRVLDGLYLLHETIGRGGFAKVKKATHVLTGERVAIKILDKLALGEDLPRVHREIQTLKSLDHPHICKMFQVLETENKIFIVMEYCRGGELFDYIVQKDRLSEDEARRIFRQIAAAIAYVHARGVAHRDLKPENILLDADNNVKLIDFGLCASLKTGLYAELETCCGSPAYAAPELIRGQKYIGTLADVWSLGVLLYALLCGSLPFDDPTLGVLYKKIQSGVYNEPRWLSEGSKNILRCMLQTNADFRLSVHELLNHTWCQEGSPEILPIISPSDEIKPALDGDVLRLMSRHLGMSVKDMETRLSEFDYKCIDVATYLILLQRKGTVGIRNFRSWGINLEKAPNPIQTSRIQKSLESEFLECDDVDSAPVAPARHASMEGGLDDSHLLTFGSPKMKEQPHENKENIDEVDFARPRIPTPKRTKAVSSQETPRSGKVSNHLSPARSAECVMTDSMRTPVRDRYNNSGNFSPSAMPSPARRKVLGSLERGLDRVRHMLTPRTNKVKKLPRSIAIATHGKGANNVSTTGSTEAEFVLAELKASFARIGMDCVQKGYRLVSKSNSVKFELEVVFIEDLKVIGIRRKRVRGDSWTYKRIMDQVLALTGVCQPPKEITPPLQTMV